MKHMKTTLAAALLGLTLSPGAMAGEMTKPEYKAGKEKIAGEYASAKISCASLSGNQKDMCVAEARRERDIALKELKARYRMSGKAE